MIHGISGKPGAGKSYEAVVRHLLPIVTKDKRKVVTNLPINIDRFCDIYGDYCRDLIEVIDGNFHNYGGERPFSKAEHYLQYENWENEKGQKVYFFIDECHLAMPSGGTEKELKEFMSMHRHYGFDVMLITQNFRKVDRDIKDMVVNHYRAIKKSMMGQDNKYILKVHDGASSSNASVVATHERVYEKKYFAFYQSHTKSKSSVDEATSNDIQIWYKHWSIKLSIVFFIFGFFILSTQFKDSKPKKEIKPLSSVQELEQARPFQTNNSIVTPAAAASTSPVVQEKPKTLRELEYERMLAKSADYHPFYKMQLSISGFAEYMDYDRRTKVHYFSASQNGQHVFTLKTIDFLMAGYEIRILGECAVRIRYYDFEDFLTCNAPTQSVQLAGDRLASN